MTRNTRLLLVRGVSRVHFQAASAAGPFIVDRP